MFLKLIALAAVGGAAWLFMRPQIPILPPGIIGKKRKSVHSEDAPEESEPAPAEVSKSSQSGGQLSVEDTSHKHRDKAPRGAGSAPSSPSKLPQTESLYHVTANERIVHELLLSGEGPAQAAEGSRAGSPAEASARGIQQIAQQAFWDVLAEGLEARPPQWERLLALLEEVRASLLELIPENADEGKQLRASVLEKLDMGYIRDRMQAGYDPEYLHQVFDFIVYSISCMEAPARRESTQKGYAQVLSGFTEAGAGGRERAGQRIRVSLDASSTPEVPVSFTTRDPWVPVHLNTPGGSPRHDAPSRASAPSPGAVSEAQSEDWVLSMNGAEGRSPQQGGLRAPSPTLGAPLEEVDVRFGMPQDRNSVTVQLLASPSRGGTPPPPGVLPGPGSAGAPGIGSALAGAARFVMEKLAEVRTDVAKARLDLLKGILQGSQSGLQYERRRYTKAVGEGEPAQALPKTKLWLQAGFRKVEPSSLREANGALRSMVGEALLALIQRPSAISATECPETLVLDLQRLVAVQNELQRLSLIGASLLVAQMLLGAKGLPSSPLTVENRRYYAEVKETFASLLAQPDVRMPHLSAAMAAMLAKRLAGGDNPAQPSAGDLQSVERLLHRIFSVNDVIYKKVQEGVLDALGIVIVTRPADCDSQVKGRLSKVGAELIQQDVMDAARSLDKVTGLNFAVCEPFYQGIIRQLWADKSAPTS